MTPKALCFSHKSPTVMISASPSASFNGISDCPAHLYSCACATLSAKSSPGNGLLTSEAVRHVGLEDDLAEDGGQRERLVALVPQRDVAVAGLQAVQGQDALADQLVVVVVDGDAQHRQIRQDHLREKREPESQRCCRMSFELFIFR